MESSTRLGSLKKQHTLIHFLLSKNKAIVDCIAVIFILLFFYTALNKTIEIDTTVTALWQTPGLSKFASMIAWTVVLIEYIVTLMLFIPPTKILGLYASLLLMLAFTGYIVYMKVALNDLPCSCGGVIAKMSWNQHLAFNILLIVLALFAIYLNRNRLKKSK